MSKKKINGICPLCTESKVLVNSHIIPKFNWRDLKESGQYNVLSSDPDKPERKDQNELQEYLLCEDCDTKKLRDYESHLAKVLRLQEPQKLENKDILEVREFEYIKVKNGLLSILWRMSVSQADFFKEVSLGEKHTERIRQIILNRELTLETEYPVRLIAPLFEGKHMSDWILPPYYARNKGNREYWCLISGLLFIFIVGSADHDKEFKLLNLKDNGSWHILKKDVIEIPFLKQYCLEVGKAHKLRGNHNRVAKE